VAVRFWLQGNKDSFAIFVKSFNSNVVFGSTCQADSGVHVLKNRGEGNKYFVSHVHFDPSEKEAKEKAQKKKGPGSGFSCALVYAIQLDSETRFIAIW